LIKLAELIKWLKKVFFSLFAIKISIQKKNQKFVDYLIKISSLCFDYVQVDSAMLIGKKNEY